MKPCSELNPRVWQGDCFMGIDQKRSEMFQIWKAGGPLLGTDSVHYPDDIAAHRLPTTPPGSRRRRARSTVVAQSPCQTKTRKSSFLPRSGLVVCWACSAVWRCKSSGQPDGGEGLVMMQGLPLRGGV